MLPVLLTAVIVLLAVIAATVTVNMLAGPFLRRAGSTGSYSTGGSSPSVSVCIPARNEAHNIGAMLRLLRDQSLPAHEILVLDDQSDDDTAALVREHAEADARIRLLRGTALPAGWTGKNWACHQLSEAASGEILCFVDADVRPGPDALRHTLNAMQRYRADALSAFPRQLLDGVAAAMVIPVMDLLVYGFLPLPLVHRSRAVSLAAANGQWFAFTRDIYRRSGGHAAVRGEIVEDVQLARAVKRSGGRMLLTAGKGSVACRMYRGWAEIRRGFSKNFFAAFGFRTLPFLAVLGMLSALFVLPFLLLFTPAWQMALVAVALNLFIRALLSWRAGHGPLSMLLHPFGIAAAVLIGLEAVRLRYRRGAVRWKERDIRVGGPA